MPKPVIVTFACHVRNYNAIGKFWPKTVEVEATIGEATADVRGRAIDALHKQRLEVNHAALLDIRSVSE